MQRRNEFPLASRDGQCLGHTVVEQYSIRQTGQFVEAMFAVQLEGLVLNQCVQFGDAVVEALQVHGLSEILEFPNQHTRLVWCRYSRLG